jgi:hypothetical protein
MALAAADELLQLMKLDVQLLQARLDFILEKGPTFLSTRTRRDGKMQQKYIVNDVVIYYMIQTKDQRKRCQKQRVSLNVIVCSKIEKH